MDLCDCCTCFECFNCNNICVCFECNNICVCFDCENSCICFGCCFCCDNKTNIIITSIIGFVFMIIIAIVLTLYFTRNK